MSRGAIGGVIAVAALAACTATTMIQLRHWQTSVGLFQRALNVTENNFFAHKLLGGSLLQEGRLEEVATQYGKAVQTLPSHAQTRPSYGRLLLKLGRTAEAVGHFRDALSIDPNMVQALERLAWLQATEASAAIRNGSEAVKLAERARDLSRTPDAGILDTPAAAYAEAGRIPEAVATEQAALPVVLQSAPVLLEQIRAHLNSFQAGQPSRERRAS